MKTFKIVLESGVIHKINPTTLVQSNIVYPQETHVCLAKNKGSALLEALDHFNNKAGGRLIRYYEIINGEYIEVFTK